KASLGVSFFIPRVFLYFLPFSTSPSITEMFFEVLAIDCLPFAANNCKSSLPASAASIQLRTDFSDTLYSRASSVFLKYFMSFAPALYLSIGQFVIDMFRNLYVSLELYLEIFIHS